MWVHIFGVFIKCPRASSLVEDVNNTQPDFCTTVWLKIIKIYESSTLGTASEYTEELTTESTSFDGKMGQKVRKIRMLCNKLRTLGHPASDLLTLRSLERAVQTYAISFPEGSHERTWATWIQNLKTTAPGRQLNLALLESEAPEQEIFF